ncbi:unnamed protein product [Prunus armeniaca]|uniref:Disease resistance protein At4g27190-like leucine-rich repeats domain-containing protein n=1 Tax=Prunus armeniaca TaxID=36596 RepID=A0A6J5TYW2_PRUAR|nr:unnamed protein product [Prunus armeniaca]
MVNKSRGTCIEHLNNEPVAMRYLFRRTRENSESKDSLTSENGSEELVVNVVFDLEGHDSAFSQLQTFTAYSLCGVEHLWKNVQLGFHGLLVNLQHVHIYACENMETIVQAAASTEDNIHEEGKEIGGSGAMTLFPKLLINSFHLSYLPSLERFCPDAYSFAWPSSTRTMEVSSCRKLKTLGFAPLSKKLPAIAENLSDDHVRGREESGGASSSTGSGCSPLVCFQSRPSTRNFTQILPQVVNREVTPTNLQTSSASDNLEHLEVLQCDLLEVIFLVQETPSTQAFDKLRELKLLYLPMLSHIWEKGLQVSSGFGNLRLLQKFDDCSAMEKIVGEAEGGGESIEDELTFPQLNCIQLGSLPKLESFCSEAYTLNWPALEEVEVYECPKLKAFAPESLYV